MGATLSAPQTIDGSLYWQMPAPDGKGHWNVWIPRPRPGESISILSADGKGYHLCTAAANPTNDTMKAETSLLERYLPEEAFMYNATGEYVKNPNWLPTPYTEQTYQKRFCRFDKPTGRWLYNDFDSHSRPHQDPLLAMNTQYSWLQHAALNDPHFGSRLAPFG